MPNHRELTIMLSLDAHSRHVDISELDLTQDEWSYQGWVIKTEPSLHGRHTALWQKIGGKGWFRREAIKAEAVRYAVTYIIRLTERLALAAEIREMLDEHKR